MAEELNVSVAAIHKNIVKALRILREELGQKVTKMNFKTYIIYLMNNLWMKIIHI